MELISRMLYRLPSIIALFFLCSALLIATLLDGLPLLGTIIIFTFLVAVSYLYQEQMLCLTIFASILIPLDLAVKGEGLFRIGPTRVVIAAFILGWFLRIVIARQFTLSKRHFPLIGYVLLYVAAAVVSSIFSVDRLVSFYGVLGRDILEQFVMFYLLLFFLSHPRGWHSIKNTLFISIALVCVIGIFERITYYNPILTPLHMEPEIREGLWRIRSTFFHPIALGCFLNLVFPFVLVEIIQNRQVVKKLLLGLLLASIAIAQFFTVSRAPWLCLILELCIFIFWWGTKDYKAAIYAIVLVAITFSAITVVYNSNSTFNKLFKPMFDPQKQKETSSEYYRILLVHAITDRLEGARWIYGYGPNAFYLSDVEARYEGEKHTLTSPDNHYARILLEYGVMGIAFFGLLIMAAMSVCLAAVRKLICDKAKLLAVGCLASVVGFIIVNASASMFQIYPLGMLFWLAVAIAINLHREAIRPYPYEETTI